MGFTFVPEEPTPRVSVTVVSVCRKVGDAGMDTTRDVSTSDDACMGWIEQSESDRAVRER